ncbi:MAG: DNA-processing protein DprA [Nevskiales bacterium]
MDGSRESLRSWLTLLHAPDIGPITGAHLVTRFGSALAVLEAGRGAWVEAGLGTAAQQALATPDEARLATDLDWLSQPGHYLIAWDDPRYPPRLKQTDGAPLLLFVVGDPEVLALPQLAIVGSRNPTPVGLENAQAFAENLARAGLIITSGLALGIDGAAHRAALNSQGLTLAVCGTGLDRVYPARHRELAHNIAQHGALVSEFPPGTPALAGNFPRRNRLISGLSLGVLVVEAALQSGSLITARLAGAQGREVFAIPGSIHNPLARGCHRLLREGAKLVESAQDILEEIGPLLGNRIPPIAGERGMRHTGSSVDTEERDADYVRLLEAMGYEPARVDQLVERTGFAADAVASMLLILEIQNEVALAPGGAYQRRTLAP